MGLSTEERLARVHQRAIAEFERVQAAVRNERMQCLKDRRFYSVAGAQWEGPLGDQFENKPRFEMNKVHLAVIRIFNEYRNNRITVDYVPKDGGEADQLADTCDGLYRADEQDSGAEEAYDNGFEEAAGGGFGAWRLRAAYEDDEDEENQKQRIRIEPIYDADSSVFFDLDAKRQDKKDAKRCWVLTSYTRDGYIETWGDDPATWPKSIYQRQFDWATPDVVYVAEYYEVEEKSELLRVFRGMALGTDEPNERKFWDSELKADPTIEDTLKATGFREVRQKRVTRRKVHKYIMNGARILEDEGYIAGSNIPIVPVYGKRWFVDNVERCMGHVRLARDAQMLKNMLISMLAEIATFSPVEKPIFTPEQMAGHTTMWSEDSVKRYPYLLANAVRNQDGSIAQTGPVGYTKAPSIPQALAELLQLTEQDLQDLLGNQQAGEQVQSNISGKLMELVQTRLDMQVFIYMSNFAKAMRRCGEIWLSMAKDVYVEEGRKMKVVSPAGETGQVELLRRVFDPEANEDRFENDLSDAKFDVTTEVGPSSQSRRAATARSLISMLQFTSDQDAQTVLNCLALMNMEGEGLADVRDYFRAKLVHMGAIKPTQQEAEELAQEQQAQQPDPQAQYLQASAAEAMARAGKAQAEAQLAQEKVAQTRADTMKTIAEIGTEHQSQVLNAADALIKQVSDNGRPI
ncbi:MAG: portal protein [Bacillota bacterium]